MINEGITHPLLELNDFLIGQSIGLSDNRNQVDFLMQSTHELDVDLLESE
jgi:hypothetical protein